MKWLTAVLLALAAVLGGLLIFRRVSPPPLAGTALERPVALPALRLVNERGEAATLSDSGGRLRLVFYGFVRCPDVCPATLATLKNAYQGLTPQQRERLRVQLITVDPGHDRPAVLRDYLGRFDPAFTGLTGDAATIDAAARAMFVANVRPLPGLEHATAHSGHSEAESGEDARAVRIHGDQVSVVDPQGRFVRVYSNGDVVEGRLSRDLPGLIRQYGS